VKTVPVFIPKRFSFFIEPEETLKKLDTELINSC